MIYLKIFNLKNIFKSLCKNNDAEEDFLSEKAVLYIQKRNKLKTKKIVNEEISDDFEIEYNINYKIYLPKYKNQYIIETLDKCCLIERDLFFKKYFVHSNCNSYSGTKEYALSVIKIFKKERML